MRKCVIQSIVMVATLIALNGKSLRAADEPSADAIRQAVERLADSKLATREEASEYLWKAGLTAESALQAATKSTDAEVRYRARAILEKFKFGLFADTSPAVTEIIHSYRNGDANARRQAIKSLQEKRDLRTILALLRGESDENLRRELQVQLSQDVALMIAPLLVSGEFEKAEPLLEVGAATDIGKCQLATYYLVRGQLDKRIAEFQTRFKDSADKEVGRQLVFLLRAKGELSSARLIAQQLQDISLESALLMELGDWKSVASLGEDQWTKIQFSANYHLIERLGYMAAYHRLAGNQAEFARSIEELKTQASQDPQQLWFCAKALFINDRPEEALNLLREGVPALCFQLLAFQHRYREAWDLAGLKTGVAIDQKWYDSLPDEKATKTNFRISRLNYALQVLRALNTVGRQEDVNQLIALVEQQISKQPPELQRSSWALLAETEFRMGNSEKAFEHATKNLTDPDNTSILRRLFGTRTPEAEVWWKFFRREADDNADLSGQVERKRLARIEDLLKSIPPSQMADDPLRKLIPVALEAATELEGEQRTQWLSAIGETCAVRGHRDLARQAFQQIAEQSAVASMRLGDLAFEDQEFLRASEWFLQAWKLDSQQNAAYYLAAISLEKAGREEEARALKEKAEMVALTARARYTLLTALQGRELNEDALRQGEIILRTAPLGDKVLDDTSKVVGDLLATKEQLRAADLWQRITMGCLRTNYSFINPDGFLRMPAAIHRARALGLLSQGDKEGTQRAIKMSMAAAPADVTLAEELVPALDKAGHAADADALFAETYATQSNLCDEYPRSAMHHNNLAWVAARCNRRLDDALRYSKKALELSPNNAAYVDTLGEVHFRRGERQDAIACAKKCIELNPKFKFYREQLERFEKDPK